MTEQLVYKNIDQRLNKWTIPQIEPSNVYHKGFLEFKQAYIIKTYEESISLQNFTNNLSLLSNKILEDLSTEYNYIHLGLVQIAVKPLTRDGLNTSILLCLRDTRHNKFNDSLLGIIESSLGTGPIYFNCYPNFSVSLSDPHIKEALCLNMQTQGYDMKEGSQNICIIYRICFKAMTSINPHSRFISKKGQTTLIQIDTTKANIEIPKTIEWKNITLPESWKLEK